MTSSPTSTHPPSLSAASIQQFSEALNGAPGDLDAWLEVNSEAEIRAHVWAYGLARDALAVSPIADVKASSVDAFVQALNGAPRELDGWMEGQSEGSVRDHIRAYAHRKSQYLAPSPASNGLAGNDGDAGSQLRMLRELREGYGNDPGRFSLERAALDAAIKAVEDREGAALCRTCALMPTSRPDILFHSLVSCVLNFVAREDAGDAAAAAEWKRQVHLYAGALANSDGTRDRLVTLLDEVRDCFTRDDDLPGDLLSRIDAAIDEDHESAIVVAWRSISTAPKDGRFVRAAAFGQGSHRVRWVEEAGSGAWRDESGQAHKVDLWQPITMEGGQARG